mmetsp:Transcript_22339/g.26887  ORF Transcript_22339/g.26887 Transcript_22339/m.26887 type:complete len:164 (-) Transcript_22339:454-945(-)|eukprot:CAMPEP_0197863954 /NCGR_PEP_ID=MMETSP1438-20131217/41778_1 /TAXON_ID=1461541 /ORGANISM="Pterosperma sp., Strain CCMP1384" /LENGTH=163 /DNA_ID=CAMNT_0043482025 /DNA_START=514 /DNA_END=1005 /DNA_ORIENTATION=+
MEKDMQIRKRIHSIYNRQQEDFSELKDYNDYLEEVEDIIFNLCEGIDVRETEAKVAAYKKENEDKIALNAAKRAQKMQEANLRSRTPTEDEAQQMSITPENPTLQVPLLSMPSPVEMYSNGMMIDSSPEALQLRRKEELMAGGYNEERCRLRAKRAAYTGLYL